MKRFQENFSSIYRLHGEIQYLKLKHCIDYFFRYTINSKYPTSNQYKNYYIFHIIEYPNYIKNIHTIHTKPFSSNDPSISGNSRTWINTQVEKMYTVQHFRRMRSEYIFPESKLYCRRPGCVMNNLYYCGARRRL